MTTHPIQYVTAADETRIAFTTCGSGMPLVFMPPLPFSHVEAVWTVAGQARWLERLATGATVALYDSRGTGLSEPGRADFSLRAQHEELRAVTRRLGWRAFALCGFFNAAPGAIAFAAEHPDLVTHLVLWGGYARGTDVYPLPFAEDPRLAAAHWDQLVDTAARAWTAGDGEQARATAAYFRTCVSPDTALRAFVAARAYDVSALLPDVRARTLVLHRRDAASQHPAVTRQLAEHIPDAALVVLPGDAASPFSGDIDAAVDVILRFLGAPDAPAAAAAPGADGAAADGAGLTAREADVLRLVARGLANKAIAAELALSVNTVERHLTNLYRKIGCRSRTEATVFALTHGYR